MEFANMFDRRTTLKTCKYLVDANVKFVPVIVESEQHGSAMLEKLHEQLLELLKKGETDGKETI